MVCYNIITSGVEDAGEVVEDLEPMKSGEVNLKEEKRKKEGGMEDIEGRTGSRKKGGDRKDRNVGRDRKEGIGKQEGMGKEEWIGRDIHLSLSAALHLESGTYNSSLCYATICSRLSCLCCQCA
jgi:hypothetical protein